MKKTKPFLTAFLSHCLQNSTANANLAHNKTVRERIGMEDRARPVTNWDAFGKKQVALH